METKRLKEFYNFVLRRQKLWYNKEILKLPPPWSDDEILSTYHFCNVYRELDKGTKHVIRKIIDTELPLSTKIFNIIFYRRFNVFNFYGGIVEKPIVESSFDRRAMEKLFDRHIREGRKLFGEAYTLCQLPFNANYRRREKHVQTLLAMEEISRTINNIVNSALTGLMEDLFNTLTSYKLIGKFLAYQICTDISYIKNMILDTERFVYVGPGAVGSVDYIFYNKKPKSYEVCCKLIYQYQRMYLGEEWKDVYYHTSYAPKHVLSLNNIQASLCEFRKYRNLKSNPKARKRYYKPKELKYGLS